MVEFRVHRRGLEHYWVILRIVEGQVPVEVGPPYEDPILAIEVANKMNLAHQVAERAKPKDK